MNAPRIPTIEDVEKAMGLMDVTGSPQTDIGRVQILRVDGEVLRVDNSDALSARHVDRATESTIEQIGRMSGEAIMHQYESAAKSAETLGEELGVLIKALETTLKQCDEDMLLIKETVETIRDKGNHVRAQIERTVALSNTIRTMCREFREKVSQ